MIKHNSRNNEEGELIKFASEFFTQIEKNNSGVLSGSDLIESLLSLGIATDAYVLKETLSMIFHCSELSKLKVNHQDFLSMFRSDVITDLILKQLNESAVIERKKQKLLNSKRIRLKSAETNLSPSNVFKLRLGLSLTGHEFHDADKAANNMITINEHLGVIERL